MSVAVIAAINARSQEDRKRVDSYKARENIEISTRRNRERAAAEARRSDHAWTADDVKAVGQRAAAAERKEKEARERAEFEARVKVERAATEARERTAVDERKNQQKNEEMAPAKSKNQLKRLLQCWNFCS